MRRTTWFALGVLLALSIPASAQIGGGFPIEETGGGGAGVTWPLDADGSYIYDATQLLELGTTLTTGHSLATGDVGTGGALEVDGILWADAGVRMDGTSSFVGDGTQFIFGDGGTSADTVMKADAGQDAMKFYLGTDTGNQIVFGSATHGHARDYDHDQTTNPTVFVQSITDPDSANDEWISITHDVTDAVIDAGSGTIKFGAPTAHIVTTETPTGTTETIDWSTGNTQVLDLTSTSGNVTLVSFTDPTATAATAVSLFLLIKQHATVPRTIADWDSDVEWAGGAHPTITATNSAIDAVSCVFVTSDTEYYCSVAQNYATP